MASLDPEQLIDALSRDSARMNLAAETLRAASETSVEAKLRLFARVLANAATETAIVDEELIVVRAIRYLEATHLRLAAILREPPSFPPVPTKPPIKM